MKPTIVKVTENKRAFIVEISPTWTGEKIKIDGDFIQDQTVEKCDYCIRIFDEKNIRNTIFLIELKGSNLSKAISQLESTINLLENHEKSQDFLGFPKKEARAICSKIFPASSSSMQTKQALFLKKYKFILKWHSDQHTENLRA